MKLSIACIIDGALLILFGFVYTEACWFLIWIGFGQFLNALSAWCLELRVAARPEPEEATKP